MEGEIKADFEVKIYHPKYTEFKNMQQYIAFLEQDSGDKNGICKVNIDK